MCFSASASFGAGVVLATIGTISIKKVQGRSGLAFASIPLLFSVQQISEGFLWLALSHPEFAFLKTFCTYTFIFFAQMVWPFWVPLAVLLLEKNKRRKKTLYVLLAMGAIVSVYLGFCLINFQVQASILGRHISYKQDYPQGLGLYGASFYMIATIVPPFFSGIKKMWSLGTAIAISYVITDIFYTDYIISVWCFFASVISIAVLAIVFETRKISKPGHALVY